MAYDGLADGLPVLADGPAHGPRLILAHGAGATMESPWMRTMAQSVADRGIRVIRFEFPFMAARRADGRKRPPDREPVLLARWRAVLAAHGPAPEVVVGGKSMGGRMASMIADAEGVRGLVCLGYPFHAPGRPDRLRAAHLADLRTPTLICQGSRDPLGNAGTVAGLTLSPALRLLWLADGDHGFKPRKASGLSEADHLASVAQAVADFVRAVAA